VLLALGFSKEAAAGGSSIAGWQCRSGIVFMAGIIRADFRQMAYFYQLNEALGLFTPGLSITACLILKYGDD